MPPRERDAFESWPTWRSADPLILTSGPVYRVLALRPSGEALAQLGGLALGGYYAPKLPGGYATNPASEAVAQGVLTGIGIGLGIEVTAFLGTHGHQTDASATASADWLTHPPQLISKCSRFARDHHVFTKPAQWPPSHCGHRCCILRMVSSDLVYPLLSMRAFQLIVQ